MNKKNKCVYFIVLFSFVMQSCNTNQFDSKKINEIINDYNNINSAEVNMTTFVNNQTAATSVINLLKKENDIFSYSQINCYKNYFITNDRTIEEYSKNNDRYVVTNQNKFNYNLQLNNSLTDYLGIKELFNDVSNNKKTNNVINTSNIKGLIRYYLLSIGKYDMSIDKYIDTSVSYNIDFDFSNMLVKTINVDFVNVSKLIDTSILSTELSITIQKKDVSEVINSNQFNDNNSNVSNIEEIKKSGIKYIKECYGNIKYISDDLYLYEDTMLSTRMKFKYFSSNTNVLTNTGKYLNVQEDTEINLKVELYYLNELFDTENFTFLAVPKTSGTGDLGSQTNMLYKGRKEIDNVNIYFIEMHKQYGVSVYVQAGDFDMLLDAGAPEDGGYVNDFLRRHISDGRLELVVASHPHNDHMGGMNTALSTIKNITYAVDYGCVRNYSAVSTTRNRFKQADKYSPVIDCVNNRNGARKVLYITNDMYVTFLNTGYYEEEDKDISSYGGHEINNTSVALILTYKNQNFFFAGDLENNAQKSLLNNENISKVDVLSSCHHGSGNANGTPLLSKARPDVSVISAALINRGSKTNNAAKQDHPAQTALDNLTKYSNKVYCNFTTGTLKVTLNGGEDVKGLGLTTPYYLDGVAVTGEEDLEFKYTKYAKKYYSNI